MSHSNGKCTAKSYLGVEKELESLRSIDSNQWLDLLFGPGNWCQFPLAVLHIMSAKEAVMLAYLHNHGVIVLGYRHKWDSWFFCTSKRIKNDIGINRTALQRLLARMRNKGLISMKREKAPPHRRLIRVNWDVITAKIIAWQKRNFAAIEEKHEYKPEEQTELTYPRRLRIANN